MCRDRHKVWGLHCASAKPTSTGSKFSFYLFIYLLFGGSKKKFNIIHASWYFIRYLPWMLMSASSRHGFVYLLSSVHFLCICTCRWSINNIDRFLRTWITMQWQLYLWNHVRNYLRCVAQVIWTTAYLYLIQLWELVTSFLDREPVHFHFDRHKFWTYNPEVTWCCWNSRPFH